MGSRAIPRPETGTPNSAEQLYQWLRYLCCNRTSRGLGGHELVQCPELLELAAVSAFTNGDGPEAKAAALRSLIRQLFPPRRGRSLLHDPNQSIQHLLGLSIDCIRQDPKVRRELAANASGYQDVAYFIRGHDWGPSHEQRLLHDIADEIWVLEQAARSGSIAELRLAR